jgi:chaperone required for assembly of F1-ATPase
MVEDKIDPRHAADRARQCGRSTGPPDKEASPRLARYAEADLACYRAEGPSALVERQARSGTRCSAGAAALRRRLQARRAASSTSPSRGDRRAACHAVSRSILPARGLSPLVTIGGSLACALWRSRRRLHAEQAWDAVSVDDRWQLEQWGSDAEAEAALANRRRDFSPRRVPGLLS